MNVTLAIIVVYFQITSILTAKGRFEKVDQIGQAPSDLQYAFIIFRHGLRTPINNLYGSEGEFANVWPDGKGGLTLAGKQLMVQVGRSLRSRYKKLVPEYDEERVSFTSTMRSRTTKSAYAVAAGMFPPSHKVINDLPHWQPIPVFHSADYDKYHIFDEKIEKASCPRYTKIKDSIVKHNMGKLSWSQKRSLKKINEKLKTSNSPLKTISNMDDLFNVWDIYEMMDLNQMPSEPWVKSMMPAMSNLAQFRVVQDMDGKKDGKTSILQYFTGPMFNQILNEMVDQHTTYCKAMLADSRPNQPKGCTRLHLHASHDLTLDAVMWALVNQKTFAAKPGDTIILEVDSKSQVKAFLYSPLAKKNKMQDISLKGLCAQNYCDVTELLNGLKTRGFMSTEDDWKTKCKDTNGV